MTELSAKCIEDALRADASPLLPIEHVRVIDMSGGCGSSFHIVAVTTAFQGVNLLQRHRMIHTALERYMPSIHALELKCYTPDVYQRLQQQQQQQQQPPQQQQEQQQ